MNTPFSTKQLLFLLVSLLSIVTLQAQETNEYGSNLYKAIAHEPGDTLIIFSDTAYVRETASTRARVLQAVPAGTKVIFLREADNDQTIKGFTASWIYVRFLQNGASREGYLWKGLTALGCFSSGDHQFLYGLDYVVANRGENAIPDYFTKLKVLDSNNKLLAAKTWKNSSGEATSISEGKLLGNMGLEGLTEIVRIYFSGEACGIPTDYYYFGWTGTELLPLPGKTQISDAGAFYHGETLLFPKEAGGQPGRIIKLIEDEEVLDGVDKKGDPLTKTTKTRENYTWDGRKAVKQNNNQDASSH